MQDYANNPKHHDKPPCQNNGIPFSDINFLFQFKNPRVLLKSRDYRNISVRHSASWGPEPHSGNIYRRMLPS
jgi:hypothetical protein